MSMSQLQHPVNDNKDLPDYARFRLSGLRQRPALNVDRLTSQQHMILILDLTGLTPEHIRSREPHLRARA